MKDKKSLIAKISANLVAPAPPTPPPVLTTPASSILLPVTTDESPRIAAEPPTATQVPEHSLDLGLPKMDQAPQKSGGNKALKSDKPIPATGTGKQGAFWLSDDDRAIFFDLGMHLYTQGVKASDNLVLRAAIRMVPRDHRLVEKVRELMDADGRKLRHRKNRD